MNESGQFSGSIERINFTSGNFVIGSLRDQKSRRMIRFKGELPGAEPESLWTIEGDFETHPTYGRQLIVRRAHPFEPDALEGLRRFFVSVFKGIGEQSADAIVDALGADAIVRIEQDPSVLVSECHLSEKKANAVEQQIRSLRQRSVDVVALLQLGLSQKDTDLLAQAKISFAMLQQDPFLPYFSISGFTLRSARRIADSLGLASDDPRRMEAAVWSALQEQIYLTSSTFCTLDHLAWTMHLSAQQLQVGLERLVCREKITVEDERIFPSRLFTAEVQIARLVSLLSYPVDDVPAGRLGEVIERIEHKENITYDPLQKEAIASFFRHSFQILNGGPGTGKSTVVRGILQAVSQLCPSAKTILCAPTGRAARRMAQLGNHYASTIHSLLEWDYSTGYFSRNEENPIHCDFLIVDEFSMVDCVLFAALLRALPTHARVLLIGDEEQLESVGPGRVFNDLIESQTIPVLRLRTLFRQKEGGGISRLCSQIRGGAPLEYSDQVCFEQTEDEILPRLKEHVLSLDEPEEMQILAPMYAGSQGILEINRMMQELVNPFDPNKPQVIDKVRDRHGEREVIFRQGDKILILSNQPASEISNGDIGSIVDVDQKRGTVLIDIDGRELEVGAEGRSSLMTHGWCVSIHKSQGSEYRLACVVVDPAARRMLSKRLLYTAVSRAKSRLLIIGDRQAFEAGCQRTAAGSRRQTRLKERLRASSDSGQSVEK